MTSIEKPKSTDLASFTCHTFTVRELEMSYTIEEEKYLDRLGNVFNEQWQSFSFGEDLAHEIIGVMAANIKMFSQESKTIWRKANM